MSDYSSMMSADVCNNAARAVECVIVLLPDRMSASTSLNRLERAGGGGALYRQLVANTNT